MPRGLGLGLQDAYGAAGGHDALVELIAQRREEEERQARLMIQALLAGQGQQRIDVERSLGEQRIGAEKEQAEATNLLRLATLMDTSENRELQRDLQKETRVTNRLTKVYPAGTQVTPAERDEAAQYGFSSRFRPHAGHRPDEAPETHTFEFLGTQEGQQPRSDFDAYLRQVAREQGRPLTATDMEQARRRFGQADDRVIDPGIADARHLAMAQRLSSQMERIMKPVFTTQQQMGLLRAGMAEARSGNANAGENAVITTYAKLLDALTGVREGEFNRIAGGESLLNRIRGNWQRMTVGGLRGLPVDQLEGYARVAEEGAAVYRRLAEIQRRRLLAQGVKSGIDPEEFDLDPGALDAASQMPAAFVTSPGSAAPPGDPYERYRRRRE